MKSSIVDVFNPRTIVRVSLLSGNIACTYAIGMIHGESVAGEFVRLMAGVLLAATLIRFGLAKNLIKHASAIKKAPNIGFPLAIDSIVASSYVFGLLVVPSTLLSYFLGWNFLYLILVLISGFLISASTILGYLIRTFDKPLSSVFFESGGLYYILMIIYFSLHFYDSEPNGLLLILASTFLLLLLAIYTAHEFSPNSFRDTVRACFVIRRVRSPIRLLANSAGTLLSELCAVGSNSVVYLFAGAVADDALIYKLRMIERIVAFSLVGQSITSTFKMALLSRHIYSHSLSISTFQLLKSIGRQNVRFAIVLLLPLLAVSALAVKLPPSTHLMVFLLLAFSSLVSAIFGPIGNAMVFALSPFKLVIGNILILMLVILSVYLAFLLDTWISIPLAICLSVVVRNVSSYLLLKVHSSTRFIPK